MASASKRESSPGSTGSGENHASPNDSSDLNIDERTSVHLSVKKEELDTKSSLLEASHIKSSRSSSDSPSIKQNLDDLDIKPKVELQNGSLSSSKAGMPKKSGRAAASKAPPRIAPLFTDLPDVTTEATSSFQVITSSTYQNKYLGLTESALECDCNEEWGKHELSGYDLDTD